jgi:hypothetical protein
MTLSSEQIIVQLSHFVLYLISEDQQSADIHVGPLGHIILIPSQPSISMTFLLEYLRFFSIYIGLSDKLRLSTYMEETKGVIRSNTSKNHKNTMAKNKNGMGGKFIMIIESL